MSYLLPWKPEFWSDLAQNPKQPFPHPNDASDKMIVPLVAEIFMFENVVDDVHVRTYDGRTPEHEYPYKLIKEPSAQVRTS